MCFTNQTKLKAMAGLVLARKERKKVLREEAQERQAYYNKLTSTVEGISKIMQTCGAKQKRKLERKLHTLKNNKK